MWRFAEAKSTYCQLVYLLWAFYVNATNTFAVLVNQTQSRAQQALANIKQECELNNLLIEDFGPFTIASSEWSNSTLVFPEYRASLLLCLFLKVYVVCDTGEFRPQQLLADDIEDVVQVGLKEGRDKAWEFLQPRTNSLLVHRNTKIVY